MSKNYDLYPKSERNIDNWRRRILGYEKMKRDMQRQIQLLKNKNQKQKEVINDYKEDTVNYIEQLQQENKHLDEVNCHLRKNNEKLKYNWNKLKGFVSNSLKFYKETDDEYVKTQRELGIRDGYKIVSGKIQELEGSEIDE